MKSWDTAGSDLFFVIPQIDLKHADSILIVRQSVIVEGHGHLSQADQNLQSISCGTLDSYHSSFTFTAFVCDIWIIFTT